MNSEAVREMTFEEEFEILQREKERVFASEKEGCEPPLANCVLRRALRCIRKLQEQQQKTDWIPCEERLPEEMCRCLVTTKDGKVTETIYDKPFDRFVLCEDAIAWQPLPESYKKEGADDERS